MNAHRSMLLVLECLCIYIYIPGAILGKVLKLIKMLIPVHSASTMFTLSVYLYNLLPGVTLLSVVYLSYYGDI